MALNIVPLLNPNAATRDARLENQRARQNALRTATAAAQSGGAALNPAAGARLQANQISQMEGDAAARVLRARQQDRAAQAGAIQGIAGTGLSLAGTIGGMGIASSAAQGPLSSVASPLMSATGGGTPAPAPAASPPTMGRALDAPLPSAPGGGTPAPTPAPAVPTMGRALAGPGTQGAVPGGPGSQNVPAVPMMPNPYSGPAPTNQLDLEPVQMPGAAGLSQDDLIRMRMQRLLGGINANPLGIGR